MGDDFLRRFLTELVRSYRRVGLGYFPSTDNARYLDALFQHLCSLKASAETVSDHITNQ